MTRRHHHIYRAGCVAAASIATLLCIDHAAAADPAVKGRPDEPVTRLVTKTPTAGIGNDDSVSPQIAGDCSAVAFNSEASNLVPGDTHRYQDVFIRDRAAHRIELVSKPRVEARADGESRVGAVSRTGRFVVYDSTADNLVAGETGEFEDVFVRDMLRSRSELVSDARGHAASDGKSFAGDISANGRFVVFSSDASNLVRADTNTFFDVFLRDRATDTTERISVPAGGGEADEASFDPAISANGRYVMFESISSNLLPADTNDNIDVFRYDRKLDVLELVTRAEDGTPLTFGGALADLSANGRVVSFTTPDAQPVAGDGNDFFDVFVRDLEAGTTTLGGASDADTFPAQGSTESVLSADGDGLAFVSSSPDIAAPDSAGGQDIFLRDRGAGTTELLSQSTSGVPADAAGGQPSISDDGRCIAFSTRATNLAASDDNGAMDVYLRRLPR